MSARSTSIVAVLLVLGLMAGCEGAGPTPPPVSPTRSVLWTPPAPTSTAVVPTVTPTPAPVEPITPDMVLVEAGTFQMGAAIRRADSHPDEQPVHTVQNVRGGRPESGVGLVGPPTGYLGPKRRVPIRTMLAPSSIATR